jgi:putative hydrolase of the HAD superfamily
LSPLADIKAVVFDIYGTLLVSSSGDVGTDPAFSDQSRTTDAKLDQILDDCGTDLVTAMGGLKAKIKSEHQSLRASGIPFPEIEICSLWKSVLNPDASAEPPKNGQGQGVGLDDLKEISLRAELLTNPVWKMPGFDRCLGAIGDQQIELGIISNAQFYTLPILEALAGKTLDELGFRRQLSHFSFRMGRAKPDTFLYEVAAKSLARFGITPRQTLYVGNDVTKDMIPAHEVGFRTGLFAGDKRSLRCGDHGDPHHHPSIDLIFTDLEQITTVLRST